MLFWLADGHKQAYSVSGGTSRQCFFNLLPNTQYKISVYTQLQNMEGPAVTVMDTTRKWLMVTVLILTGTVKPPV